VKSPADGARSECECDRRRRVDIAPELSDRTVAVRCGHEHNAAPARGDAERARRIGRHDRILIRDRNAGHSVLSGIADAVSVRIVEDDAGHVGTRRGEHGDD
jgi:hypothetical protein